MSSIPQYIFSMHLLSITLSFLSQLLTIYGNQIFLHLTFAQNDKENFKKRN